MFAILRSRSLCFCYFGVSLRFSLRKFRCLEIYHSQTFYSITQFVPNCCISSSLLICTFYVRKIRILKICQPKPSFHLFVVCIEISGTHNPSFRFQNPYGFLSLHRIICSYGFARHSPRLHPTKISKKNYHNKLLR